MENTHRLTRKEKRAIHQNKKKENQQEKINFNLKHIEPLTQNQKKTFNEYNDKNLVLFGSAGTGKTFISLYLALKEVLNGDRYKKVIIVRSVVPTRDMGFLPGSQKEKTKVYEGPYYAIFSELFGRGDSYEYLKSRGLVEFISTSFIRGITLNDSIVIVDECQNMTFQELDSIITRIGQNCKIIFCGDYRQSDFRFMDEKVGVLNFTKIIAKMKSFGFIEFNHDDIVRSHTVKEYIIQKETQHASYTTT